MRPRQNHNQRRHIQQQAHLVGSVVLTLTMALSLMVTGSGPSYGAADAASSVPTVHPVAGTRHLNPDRPACDDPDNPCYTAPQMRTYFVHRTHHFYRLTRRFEFPQGFIHKATVAHHHWCQTHPVICRQNWDELHTLYNQGAFHPCGAQPGWFCLYQTNLGQCAGGVGGIYWSCVGAYHSQTVERLQQRLTDTDDLHVSCLGDVLWGTVFGMPGGPAGMIWGGGGGALTCGFRTWLGE